MSSEDLFEVRVYVLKGDESIGPFLIDELLEALEAGRFDLSDVCLREGAIETERIQDILDWDEDDSTLNQSLEPSRFAPPETPEDPVEELSRETSETSLPLQESLYAGHPSMLNFPLSIVSVVGGAIGAIWLFPIDLRFSIVCLGLVGAGFTYLSYIRLTRDYHISPKRVEVISGLIAKSSKEIRIADIRAINVNCSGLSGILGVGNVDFFTTGDDPEVCFEKVWAAKKIKHLVRRIQDQS